MTDELKLCPFCGGKAKWVSGSIECTSCSVSMHGWGGHDLTNKRWNTRYKQTCKWNAVTNSYGEITEFMCECGCCMGYIPRFCPNCGVEVIF